MNAQEARALVDQGVQQLLEDPEAWRQWARTLARFPTYSPGNALLIHLQRPDATYVAGYHAWQQLGRHVRRGEHGITILAPIVRRGAPDREATAESPEDARPDPPRAVVGFRAVTVFAYEQTDGAPLRLPEARPLTTETMAELLSHVVGLPDVAVVFGDTAPAYGVWDPAAQRITIRADAAPDQQLKTLFHEWSHRLGVPTPEAGAARHRGLEEVTAETTAYVVAQTLGLDTHAYSQGYVAGWAGADPQRVAGVVQEVGRRVHQILGALERAADRDSILAVATARWRGPQAIATAARTRDDLTEVAR
ncbi:MAG: ArdC family protein [Firmicutes bacterium]|nr:ArdC family protein [Bacillota bacterium]